jgi:type II secretory pathway predicted ATPase ExeA
MFVEAFGLRRDPFMDTADPAFYYETIACANGRRRLAECLLAGRGLAAILGPIGAGKTTMCNAVLQDVLSTPACRAGLILDPTFDDESAFLIAIADSLDIDAGADVHAGVRTIKDRLKRSLFESVDAGTQYVLFIDEAQLLPEPLLESLRSLLNYQTDDRKLLAVALSGQPELAQTLARHPGLADRIALWLELGPLAQSEAAALLDHRLRRAGYAGPQSPFSPEAASLAWRVSGGLPRRLTAVAREAMEVAAERRSRTIDAGDVEAARMRIAPPIFAIAPNVLPAQKSRWPWSIFSG